VARLDTLRTYVSLPSTLLINDGGPVIRFPRTPVPRPLGRRLSLAAPLLLLVWGAACDKPEPESVVEIVGATTPCSGCRIELGPPLELRSEKGTETELALSPIAVTNDGQGRFWVGAIHHLARVYDANGKFLTTIGRKGGGPNDLDSPVAFLPLPGDSMLVFEFDSARGNRAFVLDSQFHSARTMRLPGAMLPTTAAEWPSRVLLTGPVAGDSSTGLTLHVVSAEQPEMKVVKSFGPGRKATASSGTITNYQRVTSAKDSSYWCADILRYRISHFAKDGTLLGTIERAPEWFPQPSGENEGTPVTPPPPKIFAIWQAPDGLLWVFGRVAGKNWRDGWPKLAPGDTIVNFSSLRADKMYGTTIEVLDPITREVVSTAALDEYVSNVLPNGNVAVFAVDSAGVPHLSIRRLTLTR